MKSPQKNRENPIAILFPLVLAFAGAVVIACAVSAAVENRPGFGIRREEDFSQMSTDELYDLMWEYAEAKEPDYKKAAEIRDVIRSRSLAA